MSNLAQALIGYAQSGGKDTSTLMRALARPRTPTYSKQSHPQASGDGEGGGAGGPSYPLQDSLRESSPDQGWQGSQDIATQIASYARKAGLAVGSEKRDTKFTASGGVSDHWVGSSGSYAYDFSGTTDRMDEASRRVHNFLGVKHSPGQWTEIHRNGYRIQVGWQVPGHYDHVHIGVRRD